jgi:hypothetical protein
MAQPTQYVFPESFIETANVDRGTGAQKDYYYKQRSGNWKKTRAQMPSSRA